MLETTSLHTKADVTNFRSGRPSGFAICDEPVLEGASKAEIASQVLDRLRVEIVVLDGTGLIVFCNAAARRLLAGNDSMFSHRNRLRFSDPDVNRWLQSHLCSASQPGERTVLVLDEDQGRHRIASLDAVRGETEEVSRLILTFSRLSHPLTEEGARQLMHHFGLTPAEQRLVHFLMRGGQLKEAAKTFGLSRHTVGNQLRSIFDKVGVRRQTGLMRLMSMGPQIDALE